MSNTWSTLTQSCRLDHPYSVNGPISTCMWRYPISASFKKPICTPWNDPQLFHTYSLLCLTRLITIKRSLGVKSCTVGMNR